MSLPKIEHATFSSKLPSNQEEIKFRPFLVKEEKILLMAAQSQDEDSIFSAIKQIINNCVITPTKLDVDSLPVFDLEYLFLQLRIHSIGESVDLKFSAREEKFTDCPECLKSKNVKIDLSEVAVKFPENVSNKIEVSENLGIVFKYPTFLMVEKSKKDVKEQNIDSIFNFFWSCIDFIYDGEKNIYPKDYTKEEGIEFLESLPGNTLRQIETFFESLPKLEHKLKIKCNTCEFEQEYNLEGLKDFFG